MDLATTISTKIKEEIDKDPENRGYVGKTDSEIAQLLNEPYTVETTQTELRTARINVILRSIPLTENIIADTDVAAAQKILVAVAEEVII